MTAAVKAQLSGSLVDVKCAVIHQMGSGDLGLGEFVVQGLAIGQIAGTQCNNVYIVSQPSFGRKVLCSI